MKETIKKILRESTTKSKRKAAGVLIKAKDTQRVFLLLRNDKEPTWSLLSGNMDGDESATECLNREIGEEISIDSSLVNLKEIGKESLENDTLDFYYFEGLVKKEFDAKIDHENKSWAWFDKDALPTPLYKGMEKRIKNI